MQLRWGEAVGTAEAAARGALAEACGTWGTACAQCMWLAHVVSVGE